MRSTQILTSLAGLVALSHGAPAPDAAGTTLGQGFSVQQVHSGYKLKNGAAEVAKTFARFGKSAPAMALDAASRINMPMWLATPPLAARSPQTSGTVVANPEQYDSEYLSPVTIGSQTFKLDFDTGSSDLWVLGQALKGGAHTYYAPGNTARIYSGETWKISYGDGSSASGNVYQDSVTIGGAKVVGQAVENAQAASASFISGPNDGLVGLAFDNINTAKPNQVKTFVTNLISKGMAPVFTTRLRKGAPGAYDFGYINSTRYTGAITYAAVNSANGFWEFQPSSYAVGTGAAVAIPTSRNIVDTGTTLIYVPASVVRAYYSKVSGSQNSTTQGGFIFPCGSTLPSFTLTVNGYKAVVPGSYINYAPIGDGTCYGGIQDSTNIGINIFGDIFIKSQFVVFDRGMTSAGTRVGFAVPT